MKKYIFLFISVISISTGIKAQKISEVIIDTSESIYTIDPTDPFPYETNSGFWQNGNGYMVKRLKLIQKTMPENWKELFLEKKAYVTLYFNAEGCIFRCFFGVLKSTPVNLSPEEWITLARLFMQIKLDMTQLETNKEFCWGTITLRIGKLLEEQ